MQRGRASLKGTWVARARAVPRLDAMHSVLGRPLRAAGAWALAGAVLLGGALGAAPAFPASAAPAGTADAAAPAVNATEELGDDAGTGAQLIVAPRAPVVDTGADDIQFGVVIRNATDAELPAGTVSLRIGSSPVSRTDELDAPLADSAATLTEAAVGATAPGTEQTATMTVPRSDFPLNSGSAPGAYVVGASFTLADSAAQAPDETDAAASNPALTTTAPLIWRGVGTQTVPLSVIVPFVLPSDIRTLPTRSQLEELAPGWDRLLTAARAQEATLAIDPRIIAGIRAYGDEAPRSAQLLLGRLESTPQPSFLLQFADADPSAQAALGFTSLLGPTNLDFVSRYGSFPDASSQGDDSTSSTSSTSGSTGSTDTGPDGASSSAPTSAAPQDSADAAAAGTAGESDADADPLPSLSELLAWPGQETVTAWPAAGRADAETLALLDGAGVGALVLSSSGVSQRGGPRATLGNDTVTVTNAGLDAAARTALSADSETERAGGVAELAALLAIDAQTGSGGVVLGLDRGATGDATDPAALLEQLQSFSWATPTDLSKQPSGAVELRPSGTAEDRLELLRAASNREGSVNELGAVLVHPEYLSGYQRTRLLELFSTRYADDPGTFAQVAAGYQKRDAELLSGVQAISTEHIQLVGSSSRVPVQLRNALPFDAVVSVEVDPASAALSVSERRFTDIAIPAEANERVLVPVRSRVSSGDSGLVVSVAAADGSPTVYTGTLSITIRSSVETIAFWVLGALALALLGFGIWRSVIRRRSRAVPAPN